ncbi:DUF1549 domain-containing protein [bacterium]|nr:DUF1549 domain-containing protein [bacterium]
MSWAFDRLQVCERQWLIAAALSLPGLLPSDPTFAEEPARPVAPPLPEAAQPEGQALSSWLQNETPLHQEIDELIDASLAAAQVPVAGPSSDAEFVRRVYLDLIGRVPGVEETREFLAEAATNDDARTPLVDRLLSSPEHVRRMQYVLDEMVMERRSGSNVPDADWQAWLRQAITDGRSWSWIASQILSADGADDANRAPAKFYLDRDFASEVVTRDVGRVFLGVDLECAQCHNHPNIDAYLQRHYYGINAFLSRSYVFADPKSKRKMLGEKADGEVKFTSVFTSEEGSTDPRLLDLPPIADPEGMTGSYVAKPDKTTRGVPKYSRREQLAEQMTVPENLDFRRNMANRVWALMIGRGLVEPLDVRHVDNPAAHPQLLNLLAERLLHHGDDLRWLMREIALSNVYQRRSSSVEVEPAESPAKTNAETQVVQAPLDDSSSEESETPTDKAATQAEDASTVADEFRAARIKPLSPEQLAWSVMQVLGVTDRTLAAKQAELAKKDGDAESLKSDDPFWQEQVLREALKSNVDQFAAQFAGQGGQKTGFDASANQALFLINGPLMQAWLEPSSGSLTERMLKIDNNEQLTNELFLNVLGRQPDANETAEFESMLDGADDRTQAVKDLTWALLASAEFRFNH